MGNHKGCPYGRLVGAYFIALKVDGVMRRSPYAGMMVFVCIGHCHEV